MTEPVERSLSSLIEQPKTRRAFLRDASLSLVIPAAGAALVSCSPGGTSSGAEQGSAAAGGQRPQQAHNSDSRLDSAVLRPHGPTSTTPATAAAAAAPYQRFDPTLPPPPANGRVRLAWHAREVPLRIAPDIVIAAWTFEGNVPGPIVHCRVGDTVEFTLTNDVAIPHSMDFHAAQINPKDAFRSVARGQSVSYTFTPRHPGAFMYHCGTSPVLMHIGSGMFGALIVSPRTPLPPAREFVLIQNEYYLANPIDGMRASDYTKMMNELPDFVVFNGRPDQYIREPIHVQRGERVRFWVLSAGPSHPIAFHVVGEQFDAVHIGAPGPNPLRGVQTFSVPPGGGMVFDLVCDIPGEFPFVNHAFGHGQKGAIGLLVVD